MTIIERTWIPAAAVVPQERSADFLAPVDGAEWSAGQGFHRGFFSTFRIRAGKEVWFHFPLPTLIERDGKPCSLAEVSLLWEVMEGAQLLWATVQHGGMERIEVSPRLEVPRSTAVPFEPEPEFAQWIPAVDRRLSEMRLDPPLPLRFGAQLSVLVRAAEEEGTVRFYGAGAAFCGA